MPRLCSSDRKPQRSCSDPAEAIDRPRHHDIEPAPSRVLVHVIEAGTLIPALRAGDARIPVHGHDLVSHPFRGGPELALLVVGRLLVRRDPEIDCCPHSALPLLCSNLLLIVHLRKG